MFKVVVLHESANDCSVRQLMNNKRVNLEAFHCMTLNTIIRFNECLWNIFT